MRTSHRVVAAGFAVGLLTLSSQAQVQVIASLPWAHGTTAGPNGSDYEPPNDARDFWLIEDFGIASPARLTRFESYGTIYPAPLVVIDVVVHIYDAMPTEGGHILFSSTPGSGRVLVNGFDYRLAADFAGQTLPAGSYFVVWNVQTHTNPPSSQIAIFWAQSGPHGVGTGLPNSAWQWNPGGAWGYPNNIRHVPATLTGKGENGVNFYLFGTPAPVCYANCDNSTAAPILNITDFLCFLNRFASGDTWANCDNSTAAPVLTVADFTCFLNAFAAGCSG